MRNLTSKALWIFLGDGGAKLFGFFTTIYLARVLGAEQYGLITIAISVLGITMWFSDLGLQTLATRSMAASDPSKREPSRYFWLKIALSITVMIVASIVIWFILKNDPLLRSLILLFILSLLPQSLKIDWYYKGVQKFQWVTLASWIQGLIYLGGLILMVSADDLLLVPLIYSASILAGALTMILSYRSQASLSQRPDFSKWKSDIKTSYYLGAGHFLSQSIILLPPLVIGSFFNELQVGYYGVAIKLILMIMLADHVFNTLLLPNLTRLWKEQPEKVQAQLSIVSRWMLFFGAAGTLMLFLSAELIITFLFGGQYQPAAPMLMILSFLLPVTFLNSVYSFGLISFGKDRDFLLSTAVGGIGCAVLLIVVGFIGNIEWLIAAVVFSEILITLSVYLRFRNTIKLSLGGYIAGLGGILLLLAISGSLLNLHSILAAIISPLILFIFLIGFGLLTRDDLIWLKQRIIQ